MAKYFVSGKITVQNASGHKINFHKFKSFELIHSMFSDNNGINVQINNNYNSKTSTTFEINSTVLNNHS